MEILGQQHAGKTSLTFALADAIINRPDGTHTVLADGGKHTLPVPRRVLFLDFERTLDLKYFAQCARNLKLAEVNDKGKLTNLKQANLFVHQPDTLEEGCDVMLEMIRSGEIGLVVIDSVPSMLSEEERVKSMQESTVGKQARAMGQLFRKAVPLVSRYGVTVALINQWRDKIGVSFGDPRTAPGGKAIAYYVTHRLDVSGTHKTPWFEEGKLLKVKAMKNKISGHRGECLYHLERGHGISREVEATEMGEAASIVTRKGSSYSVNVRGEKISERGKANWVGFLRSHPKLTASLGKQAAKRGVVGGGSAIPNEGGWDQ